MGNGEECGAAAGAACVRKAKKGGSKRDTVPRQCLRGFAGGEAVPSQCLQGFRAGRAKRDSGSGKHFGLISRKCEA